MDGAQLDLRGRNTKKHGFWMGAELSYGTMLIFFFFFPLGELEAQCQILVKFW